MTSYTVTITPDDSNDTTTTLRLDISGRQVRLTDLHVHAGAGLSTGQLPAIDFRLLLQAVNPATPTAIEAITETAPDTTTPRATLRTRRKQVRPSAKSAKGARRPAKDTAEPGKRGRSRTTKPATAAGTDSGTGGRAYRRMPDDLATVYRRIGSTSAVAGHYQVPRHTVNGWLRRLRQQGILPLTA